MQIYSTSATLFTLCEFSHKVNIKHKQVNNSSHQLNKFGLSEYFGIFFKHRTTQLNFALNEFALCEDLVYEGPPLKSIRSDSKRGGPPLKSIKFHIVKMEAHHLKPPGYIVKGEAYHLKPSGQIVKGGPPIKRIKFYSKRGLPLKSIRFYSSIRIAYLMPDFSIKLLQKQTGVALAFVKQKRRNGKNSREFSRL